MRLCVVMAVLLIASCPKPSPVSNSIDAGSSKRLVFGGGRPVTLRLPRAYSGKPMPLLLVLHGYGSSGQHHASYLGLDPWVDERGVLLVAPDGTLDGEGNRFWNTGSDACCNFGGSAVDDVKYLRELLEEIRAVYSIDPRRIFVVGHSNGGFMALRLGCELPGELAAVVSLAGAMPTERCHPDKPVSVLLMHGDRDVGVRYDGGTNILAKGGGAYLGASETMERWARGDKCGSTRSNGMAIDLEPAIPGAETTVSTSEGCPPGIEVALWSIQGGSHNPKLDASLVWAWLWAHPRL